MIKLPVVCPSCDNELRVSEMTCKTCETRIIGSFSVPALLRLEREEQDFVLEFVRCGGSLKEMASRLKKSYPTVRNILDDIIDKLNTKEEE